MKQMPMFLMMLLATALAENERTGGSGVEDMPRPGAAGERARSAEAHREAWSEAELTSAHMRKSAA